MSKKSGYAKYTFAFASDIQNLADEKRVKVANFNVQKKKNGLGSYDYLTVNFIVPRPDRDRKDDAHEAETPNHRKLEDFIREVEESIEEDSDDPQKDEVNSNEI